MGATWVRLGEIVDSATRQVMAVNLRLVLVPIFEIQQYKLLFANDEFAYELKAA